MTVIPPSIGRIVLFFPALDGGRHEDGQPFGAMIAGVNDDGTINLMAAARDGTPYGVQNVRLVQDGEAFELEKAHAFWMAYQKGQAAKAEQLQSGAASSAAAVDLTPVHARLAEIETGVEGKFDELGKWLQSTIGDFHNRLAALEPPKQAPPPTEPPAPAPAPDPAPAPQTT